MVETIDSACLRDNPLGDPSTRALGVYLPPSGQFEGKPLLLLLPGFAGEGSHLAQRPAYLGENEFGLFDRLVRTGACPEAVLVAPDCLTTLGGSQYVNSAATGRYADFVVQEVLGWAKDRFRPGRVGILGQSSGGFGALHLAIEYPGTFSAVGSSAGDLAFDLTYRSDVVRAVRAYERHGGPDAMLRKLFEQPWLLKGPFDPVGAGLIMIAMSACYSPRDDGSGDFDLPFDPRTGELETSTWARWMSFDPLVRIDSDDASRALRSLRRLHLTASSEDEWFLDVAARRFAGRLAMHGIPVTYEEFPGGHFEKRPRYEALFPSLVGALLD